MLISLQTLLRDFCICRVPTHRISQAAMAYEQQMIEDARDEVERDVKTGKLQGLKRKSRRAAKYAFFPLDRRITALRSVHYDGQGDRRHHGCRSGLLLRRLLVLHPIPSRPRWHLLDRHHLLLGTDPTSMVRIKWPDQRKLPIADGVLDVRVQAWRF